MKPTFPEIYATLKPLLKKYVPPYSALRDDDKGYELTSVKEVVFMGKKRKGVYFTAIKIQKGFVGFYLMTIYANPKLIQQLGPDLKKRLKGKSCFHINSTDKALLSQIKKALADGHRCYKKLGWV